MEQKDCGWGDFMAWLNWAKKNVALARKRCLNCSPCGCYSWRYTPFR